MDYSHDFIPSDVRVIYHSNHDAEQLRRADTNRMPEGWQTNQQGRYSQTGRSAFLFRS